jgi:hypothetical protein
VNAWVQSFDATIHHLRKARDVGNVAHFDSGFSQSLRRSARANQLNVKTAQLTREFDESGFIRNTQESAPDFS